MTFRAVPIKKKVRKKRTAVKDDATKMGTGKKVVAKDGKQDPEKKPTKTTKVPRVAKPPSEKAEAVKPAKEKSERKKMLEMSVTDLQKKYLEILGRATKSEDKPYMVWKITQQLAGKLPEPKKRNCSVDPKGFVVAPLRMGRSIMELIDEVANATEGSNRTVFIKTAIAEKLSRDGNQELADKIIEEIA